MQIHVVLLSTYDLCHSWYKHNDTPLLLIAGLTRQLGVHLVCRTVLVEESGNSDITVFEQMRRRGFEK